MNNQPFDLDRLNALYASDATWRPTKVMRRDCVDMFGVYIPRGQEHYKRTANAGCWRLSLGSLSKALFDGNPKLKDVQRAQAQR